MYTHKSYGRQAEVAALYAMFEAGRNVKMPGPRRLGKTFVLDRLVDAAPKQNWVAVKVELAGCTDSLSVFRELCAQIGKRRTGGQQALAWMAQRLGQIASPRVDAAATWYQPLLTLDHQTYFERLIAAMHADPRRRWLLLVDELPIYLKALHDKGPTGLAAARDFMNLLSRLCQGHSKVRWMVTGSIGIEPLAQAGNYLGVLVKFDHFELPPLTPAEACDHVRDLASSGQLPHRQQVTDAEARAVVEAVGWRAAFYLDALARKLKGVPADAPAEAALRVEAAVVDLLQPSERAAFGPSEEHLRKHYRDPDVAIAFGILGALARDARGLDSDALLAALQRSNLSQDALRQVLIRLDTEGYIAVDDWTRDAPRSSFRNPLLRRWWRQYRPQAN